MGKRSRADDSEEPGLDEISEELRELEEEARATHSARQATEEVPRDGMDPEDDGRRARVMRFAKRLMDRRELSHDTREILGSVLATSDKAKTEAVKLVAREVRSYLDALELKEDLKELITSYSLEISISLKPLADAVAAAPAPAPVSEGDEEED